MGRSVRHAGIRALAAALLPVALMAVAARPARAATASQILQAINQERAANGLPLVSLSAQLSTGNANHDNYERINGSPSSGYDIRGENPSKPGYTQSGAQAGLNSLLAFGTRSSSDIFNNDDWAFGDVFDNAPNHLVELMDPAVQTIGADQLDFNQPPYGTIHISSVDVRSAPLRTDPSTVQLYSYIGPDGRAPSSVTYVEGPTANQVSGPWLFVWFLKPTSVKLALQSIALEQPDGTPVPSTTSASGGFTSAPGGSADVRAVGGSRTPTTGLVPRVKLTPPKFSTNDPKKKDKEEFAQRAADTEFDYCVQKNQPWPYDGPLGDYCSDLAQYDYDQWLNEHDPPDPNYGQIALPRPAPADRSSCRGRDPARRVCQHNRALGHSYVDAAAAEAAIAAADFTALNRLGTATEAGNDAGERLQAAVLETLAGELAAEVQLQARDGQVLASELRRSGVHVRVSGRALRKTWNALTSGHAKRFPPGLTRALAAHGISAAQFSTALRQSGGSIHFTSTSVLAALTTTPSTASMFALYNELGPSGVGAIVSSLASTGAISTSEANRLGGYVLASEAATTEAQRDAAMAGFLGALDPLPNGQLRTFLETAATGLTGSDGYSLVVHYTVNGKAQTARIPVPLEQG